MQAQLRILRADDRDFPRQHRSRAFIALNGQVLVGPQRDREISINRRAVVDLNHGIRSSHGSQRLCERHPSRHHSPRHGSTKRISGIWPSSKGSAESEGIGHLYLRPGHIAVGREREASQHRIHGDLDRQLRIRVVISGPLAARTVRQPARRTLPVCQIADEDLLRRHGGPVLEHLKHGPRDIEPRQSSSGR